MSSPKRSFRSCRAAALFLCLLLGSGPLLAEHAAGQPVEQSLDIRVLHPPVPAVVDGRRSLLYELHVTSFAEEPLELKRVDAIDARTEQPVASLIGRELISAMSVVPSHDKVRQPVIEPGRRAIVYMSAVLQRQAGQAFLRHRLAFSRPGAAPEMTVTGGPARTEDETVLELTPPLRGGPWTAVYDPQLPRGHRRFVYAVAGAAKIPGRFAIDWMPAPDSRGSWGGKRSAADGIGAEVLAVADARVVAVKDWYPDARKRETSGDLDTETGNMIVLDLGSGQFASYQHLSPGLLVKKGDRVRRGQVIGRLGASGSAVMPHLHFSVSADPAPLAGEGLPYRLTGARVVGSYDSFAGFMSRRAWRRNQPYQLDGLPAPNAVIMFGN